MRRESRFMTDEARHYKEVGREFDEHGAVNHGAYEYARGDITTNTVEGYYVPDFVREQAVAACMKEQRRWG